VSQQLPHGAVYVGYYGDAYEPGSTYKLKVDEFEANGGARLKEVERAANDFCAHELGDLLGAG